MGGNAAQPLGTFDVTSSQMDMQTVGSGLTGVRSVRHLRDQPRARSEGSVAADGGRRDRAGDQLSEPEAVAAPEQRRRRETGEERLARYNADESRSLRERIADTRWRRRIAARRSVNQPYRIGVGVVGGLIVALGIAAIPLPGPGWLIVIAGLFVLATEFVWAERLLEFTKQHVKRWTDWVVRPAGVGAAC